MGKGQKLYSKAKQIVAGGNMLLSKRPEMFLPEHWPAYFTKTILLSFANFLTLCKKLFSGSLFR